MATTPATYGLRSSTWAPRAGQLARYASVSVIATSTSLAVLGVEVGFLSIPAGRANVVAVLIGMVPSFELSRRWVWGHYGRPSLRRQIVPFFVLSAAAMALSTVAVGMAGQWALRSNLSRVQRVGAIDLAMISAFGTLWVVQFLILDRFLFTPSTLLSHAVQLTPDGQLASRRVQHPNTCVTVVETVDALPSRVVCSDQHVTALGR